MKRNQLLTELEKQGVKLSVQNDKLIIDAPKGVLTPELRQSLKEYKQEILSLLRQTETTTPTLPIIQLNPSQKYEPFPLTDIQKAYWIGRSGIFELGNVGINGYVEFEAINLDISRLSAAWQQLIDRHDMLRAIVLPTGEQQVLEWVSPYQISQLDLRGLESQEVEIQLAAIRRNLSHQILPSERWPLFDIRATYLDNQRVRLHINLDLLMMDAASIQILFQEWNQLYNNPEVKLPPLTRSFRDYVINKNALKSPESIKRSRDYWFSRLDSLPPAPELPLICFPNQLKNHIFKRYRGQLPAKIWLKLKERGEKIGLTPSIILLTAFAEVLTLWSKNPNFTLNLTVFERLPLHPEVNQIVGDFTNTILLPVDNSTSNTFTIRAQKIKQQLLQNLDHIQISGIEVLQELARRNQTGLTALMPIVFTSILGINSPNKTDLEVNFLGEEIYSVSQTPQVWLDHQVTEQKGELLFNWDVVAELFPNGLIDDMFTAYCSLLDRLATSDSAWFNTNRQLLPPAQLKQRNQVNNTSALVSQQTLHGLFINQVKVQPKSPAIIAPNCQLTYQELYQRAAHLAHRLWDRGATANNPIAVVMEKGWEQVVAVLGILMSGAAYLPIDPNQPQERQWYLLAQGEVNLVVTQPHVERNLSWPEKVQLLHIHTDDNLEGFEENSLLSHSTNQDLAYVIYTSGSTGLPKGVMINHRGAVNTILDINQRFGLKPSDRILALSALNFDLSVYDIFGILAAGGTIVIPNHELVKDPAHWLDLMLTEKVTLWNSVPALMQMLVEYLSTKPETIPLSLRLVLLSGDWLAVSLPQQIRCLWSQVQVVSLGGATEASIWSIYYPIETVNPDWHSIPYGKPLSNQQVYVFNKLMEATPVWVSGQIYIGGIGLAVGYWQDEEKTEASFIIHPVTKERLYKTGDLGRYLPDGNIEFLGREDFQVKINGHRIELGEIEAALKQHPTIKEAVVSAVGEKRGNKSLIGYFIRETGKVSELTQPEITNTQLRCFLKEKLPDYMIPSVLVPLEFLPLTPNGKINRQALPVPSQIVPESEKTFVAPRNSVEKLLAETWSEVFKFEQVSIHDNFFELGGYSFLALQLTSKINQKLNTNISLSTLFQYPTIAKLAELIVKNPNVVVKPTYLVPIQIEGTQPPLFCIHPSGGQVMVYQHLATCLGAEQPVYGIQSRALNDPNQEHQSIEDMAIEYTNIIRQYQSNGPYYLMGWSMGGVLAVSVAKELEQQQQKVAFVGVVDALLNATSKPDFLTDLVSVFGATLVNSLTNLNQIELQKSREELNILTPLERLEWMLTWGQKRNVISGDISMDILEKQFILNETHEKLLRVHRVPQIQSKLYVWWASERLGVEISQTDWSQYTTGECYTRNLDGSHFTIIRPPYINIIAQELKKCLAAVSS